MRLLRAGRYSPGLHGFQPRPLPSLPPVARARRTATTSDRTSPDPPPASLAPGCRWRARDDHRDSVGEADHHRPRNELHRRTETCRTEHHQHDARQQRANVQTDNSVLQHNSGHDDDERPGRAANLCLRAAQRGDQKSATTAQYNPVCGGTPEAMANAIASGSATRPTVMPAIRSERNFLRL